MLSSSSQFKIIFFLFIFITILSCGCSEKSKPETIPMEEVVAFCEELETSILRRNPEPFNKAFDKVGFKKKILNKLTVHPSAEKEISNALDQYQLGNMVLDVLLKEEILFEVTRIYNDKKGKTWVVFRFFNINFLNYLEFKLEKKEEEIIITESYAYNTGQYFSNMMFDVIQLSLNHTKGFKNLTDKKEAVGNAFAYLQLAQGHIANSELEEALSYFEKIDYRLRLKPYFSTFYISLLSNLDEEKYLETLNQLNSIYPNEERFNVFNELQISMRKGEVEKTRKNIHDFSKFVGNDFVLDFYEAMALFNNDNYEKAIFYFDKFIDQRPNLLPGYLGKTESYIMQKDFEKAAKIIVDIDTKFDIPMNELEEIFISFPEFLKSPELDLAKKGLNSM